MSTENAAPPLNIGIIGAGFVGQNAHIANYAQIPACRIVALAELRPELRRRVAQRYEIPRTYATHTALLQDPDVEAVVAVTPRSMTGPVALDCLNAGKHLFTEKPMAGTVAQAEKLVAVAAAQGVKYAVGYLKRHDAGILAARQILDDVLDSGTLGPVIYARAHNFMGESYCNISGHIVTAESIPADEAVTWPEAPDWLAETHHRGYARYLNTQCHHVNLLRYFFGKTPAVDYFRFDGPEAQLAVFDFGDFTALLETGNVKHRNWDDVFEIYFAQGCLRVVCPSGFLRNIPARVELHKGGEINEISIPQLDWTWAFHQQTVAFVDDILEDREPVAGAADALEDMRLIEEMWRMEIARTRSNMD